MPEVIICYGMYRVEAGRRVLINRRCKLTGDWIGFYPDDLGDEWHQSRFYRWRSDGSSPLSQQQRVLAYLEPYIPCIYDNGIEEAEKDIRWLKSQLALREQHLAEMQGHEKIEPDKIDDHD